MMGLERWSPRAQQRNHLLLRDKGDALPYKRTVLGVQKGDGWLKMMARLTILPSLILK
jgi:hypothetical protein